MDIPVFTGTHADFLIIVSTTVPTVQSHVLIETDVDRTWLGNLSSISTVMATIRKIFLVNFAILQNSLKYLLGIVLVVKEVDALTLNICDLILVGLKQSKTIALTCFKSSFVTYNEFFFPFVSFNILGIPQDHN